MFGKLALAGAAPLLALIGYATGAIGEPAADDPTGTIYHYIRSNIDGSDPEQVYVYRAARNRIEIYKAVRRCTEAAFVTAWVNPETGLASMMTGGRLLANARHENFASLDYDGSSGRLDVSAVEDEHTLQGSAIVREPVWHLYDSDLASLSVQTMGLADPRAGFSFGLPVVDLDDPDGNIVHALGRADARFVGEENWHGTPALRFSVGGSALDDGAGPLWIDAERGHLLAAKWGVPNHAGMTDFSIRLAGVEHSGDQGWHDLLTKHFEGCATA